MISSTTRTQHTAIALCVDFIIITLSVVAAYALRFDFVITPAMFNDVLFVIALAIPIKLLTFVGFGLYRGMYRFTSIWDLLRILKATTVATVLLFSIIALIHPAVHPLCVIPRSILLLDFVFTMIMVHGSRIAIRLYFSHIVFNPQKSPLNLKKLLLIGAGNTGNDIAREVLSRYRDEYEIVAFLDDDGNKRNAELHGIPVMGKVSDISGLTVAYDEIIIAAPSATGPQMRRIVEYCKQTGVPCKIVPSLPELINDKFSIKMLREVQFTDLLGREEIHLDRGSINQFIKGKRVLVTGAGGSIGSELVRQCLAFSPAELILLDNSEQNLFTIQQECTALGKSSDVRAMLGNIRDKALLDGVFNETRPQVVLHAAAYKHVPIQELHPWAAVSTNVGGTMNLIELSGKYEVEKFVLVSTDKAVTPINVMGVTKRLAERMIQTVNDHTKTVFLAVRFGNVIGSSGSVIPTFQQQIKDGGPVTITHPDMTRYFMSVSEASQLILQAGAIGERGQIFLLEMGKPIKIVDMAKDLIRLSGLEPEVDIPITYTGLRPGEKLYEQLATKEEKVRRTSHDKIVVLKDSTQREPWDSLKKGIDSLLAVAISFNSNMIKQRLKQLIPEYEPQDYYPPPKDVDLDHITIEGQA